MQCQKYVARLGRLYEELKEKNTEVLVIGGGDIKHAEALVKRLKVPFPVLADPDRSVYLSYGLDKAMLMIQRSASMIVNTDGEVAYFHKATNPMEWLDRDNVTQVVEEL